MHGLSVSYLTVVYFNLVNVETRIINQSLFE